MTDNDIKKALECCKNNRLSKCHKCPVGKIYENCSQELLIDALDLINRQKAENKELQDLMVKYNADLTKQEAEIERLKTLNSKFEAEIYRKGVAIMGDQMTFPETFDEFAEQYKITDTEQVYTNGTELIPIFRVKQWLTRTIHTVDEHTAKIKAEAYREFAELLFKKAEIRNHRTEEYHYVLADDIVDLLKEKVGEDNTQ